VLFDNASRGRYATDASIYQIMPIGVVVPRDEADARLALDIARDFKAPLLPRGGGTSQCGQTVGEALVIDNSKYLNQIIDFDPQARTVTVQPGIVLDHLNAWLKPHGLWFPVDVSTAAQCTIGGMTGNNSCGSRSIQYGNMVHNVLGVQAILASGEDVRFDASGRPSRRRTAPLPTACAASPRASATPSRRCIRRCCAAWAATTSTSSRRRASGLHRRRQRQPGASAGGLGRHARLFPPHHAATRAAAGAQGAGRGEFPDVLPVDGSHAPYRGAEAGGRGTGRPHHDRPGAQQSRIPARHRPRAGGRARGDPAGGVRRRGSRATLQGLPNWSS
jgi:hypothetical protein